MGTGFLGIVVKSLYSAYSTNHEKFLVKLFQKASENTPFPKKGAPEASIAIYQFIRACLPVGVGRVLEL
ncbi:hypothetical protein [Komagataeibacter swingsii]|uniref:Uncharacterized protein n=1 Tax=Komagataeibacter swingsii TaxID=215220 RepID=A0A850P6X7_9PROT|nr:hypothetical protein [Komagataeibacter swingsii]NVN38076.1 hypothetical protein [Komagataeibacter swingsii]